MSKMSRIRSFCGLGRSALGSARAVPRAQPFQFHLFSVRFNSSIPGGSKGGQSYGRALASSAIVGFTAAVLYNVGRGYLASDSSPSAKCDGVPAVDLVDINGKPWHPVDAYEKDDPKNPMRIRMANWVKSLQDHIVVTLEAIEASHPPLPSETNPSAGSPKFKRDAWIRPEGGEGSSCVISGGRVFEKGGVNISIIHGKLPPAAQKQMRADHSSLPADRNEALPFFATGLSIVLHPRNPHVPTVHLNYRYFELHDPETDEVLSWWFGGGTDLTPSYLDTGDVEHFHSTIKEACDKHNTNYYPQYKKACDKYFYLPMRNETRGVGGIFFDDLNDVSPGNGDEKPTRDELFDYIKSVSSAFLPAYVPIVWRNKDKGWTDEERRWQLLRRGRYVEFNLVYDRGTKFGLHTPGARVESILMTMPETARWEYMTDMGKPGTKEGELMEILQNPRDWV